MSNCKFHKDQPKGHCKWCKRWHKTFKYFKKKGCENLTYYWVVMEHYSTGESFSKIGLTSKTVEQRFKDDSERFKIDIMKTKVIPLYAAVTIENHALHAIEREGRKYNPKSRISGWSECFI